MVKRIGRLVVLAGAAMLPMQSALADHHETPDEVSSIKVVGADGKEIGFVVLQQTPNGVLVAPVIEGLPQGWHGFHIHQTGICDPEAGFKTSGGHFAPRSHAHGIKEAAGPHAGDMPNQFVGDDGRLIAHVLNPNVTLGPGFNSLIDEDGSALVVHAGADDYTSQPTGAAGGRLACAVLSPPKKM